MFNVSITKEFSWDMAHILAEHEGLCSNLHGHTYKMQVEISSKEDIHSNSKSKTDIGMITDFSNIKKIVKQTIVDRFDHSFVFWINSTDLSEQEISKILIKNNKKIITLDFRSTVEELALYFAKLLQNEFLKSNLKLVKLKLWETPTSYSTIICS